MKSDCVDKANSLAAPAAMPPASRDHSPSADILARWATLIGEYEAFRDALRWYTRQFHWPGVGPYIAMLQAEAAVAAKALEKEEDSSHSVKQAAMNIAARETMWRIIKTSPGGVLALERRFPKVVAVPTEKPGAARKKKEYDRWGSVAGMNGSGSRAEGVFVNAVVDDGREWLRVVTTTTQQLLVSLAENGWEWGEVDGEEDGVEDAEGGRAALDDIADVPLVEMVLELVGVARANRSRGAYPRICIVLTRIDEDGDAKGTSEVARFLRRFRSGLDALAASFARDIDGNLLSVAVHSARSPRTTATPAPDLAVALQQMLPDVSDHLTPTLNIDTSILIALASDISHGSVAVQDWFPAQRVDEIKRESQRPGHVLHMLCDVMKGRKLVCTREAASAFRAMIRDMAQVSEQQRAALLVQGSDGENEDAAKAVQAKDGAGAGASSVHRYRALSAYPDFIPDDLMLPITVIDEDWTLEHIGNASSDACPQSALPAVANRVAQEMDASVPTLAVFFYGWSSGSTTITTNLNARNRISRLLEKYRTSSHEQAPLVWVCRQARSLNGTNPRASDESHH